MFQLQIFQFSICPLFWAQLCSKDFKIDRWPNMLYLEWQSFQSNWNFGTVRLYIILSFFSSWARRVFPAFNLHSVDLWSNLLVGDMKYGLTKHLPILSEVSSDFCKVTKSTIKILAFQMLQIPRVCWYLQNCMWSKWWPLKMCNSGFYWNSKPAKPPWLSGQPGELFSTASESEIESVI